MKIIADILLAIMLAIVIIAVYKISDYSKSQAGTTVTSVAEVRRLHAACTGTTTTTTIYNRPPGNPRKPIAWTVSCEK